MDYSDGEEVPIRFRADSDGSDSDGEEVPIRFRADSNGEGAPAWLTSSSDDGEGVIPADDDGEGTPDTTIRIGIDGREYVTIDDPVTGLPSDARIERFIKATNRVILSFAPYLGRRNDLLPQEAIDSGFRRRPAYSFKMGAVGLANYSPATNAEPTDPSNPYISPQNMLNSKELKAKIHTFGSPIIVMAPWDYESNTQRCEVTRIKLKWPSLNQTYFTTRTTFNEAIKGGDARIVKFWTWVGQQKPNRGHAQQSQVSQGRGSVSRGSADQRRQASQVHGGRSQAHQSAGQQSQERQGSSSRDQGRRSTDQQTSQETRESELRRRRRRNSEEHQV